MDLLQRDRTHVWHPLSPLHRETPFLPVARAKGAYLYTEDGRKIFDAISSWWVNLHGHGHPYLHQKITEQMQRFEQVIFGDCTHEPAVTLAERLKQILPGGMDRVFFADNGSTAVESALKVAIQYWANMEKPRTKIVALQGGYHGDTFGSMSAGERGVYSQPFWPLLFEVKHIAAPLRGVHGTEPEPLSLSDEIWEDAAAFIYEPLVQGANGMLMQDLETMKRILRSAKEAGVLCIADEVMTGFGRTGRLFASEAFGQDLAPDIICLSKGLTGGVLPLSATVCNRRIVERFETADPQKMLLHSHSFTGNALGCAVANASLDLLLPSEAHSGALGAIEAISASHRRFAELLKGKNLSSVLEVRQEGTILAVEFTDTNRGIYSSPIAGRSKSYFYNRGLLLRPLGNVTYLMPPYCSSQDDLNSAYQAILDFGTELAC